MYTAVLQPEHLLPETDRLPEKVVYAHSLSAIRRVGEAVLTETCEIDPLELAESWQDFYTAVQEHLITDVEYGESLTFNSLSRLDLVDGQVVNRGNSSMVGLVRDGLTASRQMALTDSRMQSQVLRDEGDLRLAEEVDRLEAGRLIVAVSMDPKEDLQQNPDFWEGLGYREGRAVLQVYYKKNEIELLAGAFSISGSDSLTLSRMIQEKYGVSIPGDTSSNEWINHWIEKSVSLQEAQEFGLEFQKEYNHRTGNPTVIHSVTEFIENNIALIHQYFDGYIVALGRAVYSGKNNEVMASLAKEIIQQMERTSDFEELQLIHIAGDSVFTDDDGRFMDSKIRYALVERLRQYLPEFLANNKGIDSPASGLSGIIKTVSSQLMDPQELQHLNELSAQAIQNGFTAGRSYGGCASIGSGSVENGGRGSQDIYGGNLLDDKYGSRTFECSNGHTNTRPKDELIEKCQKCGVSVRC